MYEYSPLPDLGECTLKSQLRTSKTRHCLQLPSYQTLIDAHNVILFLLFNVVIDLMIQGISFQFFLSSYRSLFQQYSWIIISSVMIPTLLISIIFSITNLKRRRFHNKCQYCITLLITVAISQFFILLIPNLHSMLWGYCIRSVMDRNRNHISFQSRNLYFDAILKYCVNNNASGSNKQIIRRIIATNYYLQSMISSNKYNFISFDFANTNPKYLQKMRNFHNNGYKRDGDRMLMKLIDLKWRDIMVDTPRESQCNDSKYWMRNRLCWIQFIYWICFNVIVFGLFCLLWRPFILVLIIYLMIQGLNYKLRCKYYQMELFLNHILVTLSMYTMRYQIAWEKLSATRDELIEDIEIIYEIMFDQINEIECVYQYMEHYDIAGIVAQYLWFRLPDHSNMEQQLQLFYEGYCREINSH